MSHYGKEGPFKLPEGWTWCVFPEVADLISGQDFPPQRYNSDGRGIPYIIGASNIDKGHLNITRWTDSPSVFSDAGDILVVCKGAGVGKVGMNDFGRVHIARQIQAIRINNSIATPEYMHLLIKWCIPSVVSFANGLIPGLKRELLLGVQLPIPPINEQWYIYRLVFHDEVYSIDEFPGDLYDGIRPLHPFAVVLIGVCESRIFFYGHP